MITEFNYFIMPNKNVDFLNKLNQEYTGQKIKIRVLRPFARRFEPKEEEYTISKIYLKEPNYLDRERRFGSLMITLKSRSKLEIEITNQTIYILEEYDKPYIITPVSDNLKDIVNSFRNL